MTEIILKHLDKSNRRSKAVAEMVKAVMLSRDVGSAKCANYLSGTAKKESKIKRVERFYSHGYLDQKSVINLLITSMKPGYNILSMDRTNWEYGNKDINALAVYGENETSGGLLNLELLDNKGGNSNFADRRLVLEPVIGKLGIGSISALLCDREFFSFEFVHYLIENGIPFVIRIKENLTFIQPLLRLLRHCSKTLENQLIGVFQGKEIRLDLSAKKLKDEYLLTVSYKVKNPLKMYRCRWKIERFFKCIKSAGFNVERTHMTIIDRLKTMLLLCAVAYVICLVLGILRHEQYEPLKFKKTLKCHQFSFFRYGLDWVTEFFFSTINRSTHALFSIQLLTHVR